VNAQSQRRLRRIHLWLGTFFAPSIIFFALSGSIQAVGFQDRSAGYAPPAWIAFIANVHKHGALLHPAAHVPAVKDARPKAASGKKPSFPNPFSLFAMVLGILLAAASALGVWIAFLNRRERRVTGVLLAAGLVVPIILLVG